MDRAAARSFLGRFPHHCDLDAPDAVRARIKKLKNTVETLKGVPVPPSNIREKVQTYVQGLTRPIVGVLLWVKP
jgi:hypothetical protein